MKVVGLSVREGKIKDKSFFVKFGGYV